MASIDMDAAVRRSLRDLSAQIADLTLELNVTRAAHTAAVTELEELKAAKPEEQP